MTDREPRGGSVCDLSDPRNQSPVDYRGVNVGKMAITDKNICFTKHKMEAAMRNCYLKGKRLIGRDRYCLSCLASYDCEEFNYKKALDKVRA